MNSVTFVLALGAFVALWGHVDARRHDRKRRKKAKSYGGRVERPGYRPEKGE